MYFRLQPHTNGIDIHIQKLEKESESDRYTSWLNDGSVHIGVYVYVFNRSCYLCVCVCMHVLN